MFKIDFYMFIIILGHANEHETTILFIFRKINRKKIIFDK